MSVEPFKPLRIWTPEDYPLLASWWTGHGWPAIPQKMLPPLGVIANNQAAGFLYMDNGGTGVAMLEWLVTDPKAKPTRAAKSLLMALDFLKQEALRMNYTFILATCKQRSLSRFLERAGFGVTDSGMIHHLGVFV